MFITICIRNKGGKSVTAGVTQQGLTEGVTPVTTTTTNTTNFQEAFNNFIAQSQVNLDEVMDAVQEQIILYDHWDNEPWVRFLLHTSNLGSSSSSPTVISPTLG